MKETELKYIFRNKILTIFDVLLIL